jgi:hypothetical protein
MRWIETFDVFVEETAETVIADGETFPATSGGCVFGIIATLGIYIYQFAVNWPTHDLPIMIIGSVFSLFLALFVGILLSIIGSVPYWFFVRGIYVICWCIDQIAFMGIRVQGENKRVTDDKPDGSEGG